MTTAQAGTTQTHHRRAVRFFWGLLIGATVVSLVGNIAHAVLPYIPRVVVQIGAAAVPPVALLGVPGHQVGSSRLMGGRSPIALWRRRAL